MKHIRWVLVILGAGFLSACFMSNGDLIAPKEADYPIADGTRFTFYKLEPDGKRSKDAPQHAMVTRRGAFYSFDNLDENDDIPVIGLMDDIGGGNYIALMHDQDHKEQSIYGAFSRRGEKWLLHSLICNDFQKLAATQGKTLEDFGITKKDSDCKFSIYANLKSAVMFELQYGKPDAEYVPVR